MVRGAQAQDLFNQIMGKTLTLMIVSTKDIFSNETNYRFSHILLSIEKFGNQYSGLL